MTLGSPLVPKAHFAHGGEGQEARSEVPGNGCPPPQQPYHSDVQVGLGQLLRGKHAYVEALVAIINYVLL